MSDFIRVTNGFGHTMWLRPESISFIAPVNCPTDPEIRASIIAAGETHDIRETPDELYSLIKGEPSKLP